MDGQEQDYPMAQDRLRLMVVVGSTREGRFGPTVADWFVSRASANGRTAVDVVDLMDVQTPSIRFTAAVAAADAVVVVTPEYNHSFPGPLKTAIDSVRGEWAAKPVGFVSYGGVSGGLRAVEALRTVFAELHCVTVRESVSFPMAWDLFDGAGELKDPSGPDGAAAALLGQLLWWARTLRDGRAARPYGSA